MKKTLLLLFTTFALSCCNKDDDQPKTELEKLPPATQTGANTAGCLVNGVAFLPKGYVVTGNLFCNYIDGEDFVLAISDRTMQGSSDIMRVVSFGSQNQNLHDNVGTIFQLGQNNNDDNSKYGNYIIYNNDNSSEINYETTSLVRGEFKITYHNYNNAILSGTFWFDAINSNGEIVKVREGRFDKHY
jgi:hypothetical protein